MIPLNGIFHRVRNWADRYETHRSRELQVLTKWFPMPLGFEGLGFRWIGRCHSPEAVYGIQQIILQFAAETRQPHRGTLVTDDRPLTARHLATMTGWDVRLVEHAFTVLASDEVSFLEQVEVSDGHVVQIIQAHALPESAGRDTADRRQDATPPAAAENENAAERDGARRDATHRDDSRPAPPPDCTPPLRENQKEEESESRGRIGKTAVGTEWSSPNEKRSRGQSLRIADDTQDRQAEECSRAAELAESERAADNRDVAWLATSVFKILAASGIAMTHYAAQANSTQAVLRLVMHKATRDKDVAYMIRVATDLKNKRRKHRMRDWQAAMNKKYGEPTNVGGEPTTKGLETHRGRHTAAG